jgi:hypothetical protein
MEIELVMVSIPLFTMMTTVCMKLKILLEKPLHLFPMTKLEDVLARPRLLERFITTMTVTRFDCCMKQMKTTTSSLNILGMKMVNHLR